MSRILIISSQIHTELATQQLEQCLRLTQSSTHLIQVEKMAAGTYEIPFVIQAYQQKNKYDAYLALGLILQKNPDHYETIMSHIKTCFTQFAMQNIIVGNGIITGKDPQDLAHKIHSDDPCLSAYPSAWHAINYLLKLQQNLG